VVSVSDNDNDVLASIDIAIPASLASNDANVYAEAPPVAEASVDQTPATTIVDDCVILSTASANVVGDVQQMTTDSDPSANADVVLAKDNVEHPALENGPITHETAVKLEPASRAHKYEQTATTMGGDDPSAAYVVSHLLRLGYVIYCAESL
jgi:hypothetical protein